MSDMTLFLFLAPIILFFGAMAAFGLTTVLSRLRYPPKLTRQAGE